MTEFTGSRRTETQSIESEASRDEVIGVLAEATRIPEWAPPSSTGSLATLGPDDGPVEPQDHSHR